MLSEAALRSAYEHDFCISVTTYDPDLRRFHQFEKTAVVRDPPPPELLCHDTCYLCSDAMHDGRPLILARSPILYRSLRAGFMTPFLRLLTTLEFFLAH